MRDSEGRGAPDGHRFAVIHVHGDHVNVHRAHGWFVHGVIDLDDGDEVVRLLKPRRDCAPGGRRDE